MSDYKNRMVLPLDTPVWHYTSLEAVSAMHIDKKMRLSRIDTFRDPFEGSVPQKQVDDQVAVFGGQQSTRIWPQRSVARSDMGLLSEPPYRDPWAYVAALRRAKLRSAHAICWVHGEESEAMWRLYCAWEHKQGLALCTTLGKLEQSVIEHDVYVSPITYRPYHEGDAFDDELDAFFHKRFGFGHEHEVRILDFNHAHYAALAAYLKDSESRSEPFELPAHLFLDWPLADVIDRIEISPYASEEYENLVRHMFEILGVDITIELSILHQRRHSPAF